MLGNSYTAAPALVEGGGRKVHGASRFLHPCGPDGGCLLDITHLATAPSPTLHERSQSIDDPATAHLLLDTASAAKWRRGEGSPGNSDQPRRIKPALSDNLVLKVAVMEEVHGVDVSWLHRPHKGIACSANICSGRM